VPTAGTGRDLAGRIMVPAGPSVLWKMATPRRYIDKDYMNKGCFGNLRRRFSQKSLIDRCARERDAGCTQFGYFYQLLAMTGWTSLPWLWSLPQPTLILMEAMTRCSSDQRPHPGASYSERAASDDR